MTPSSSPTIENNELTTVYSQYDYWTGRALRILLCDKSPDIGLALRCLNISKRLKAAMGTRQARDWAAEDYAALQTPAAREATRVTDLQLRVLELLATTTPSKATNALILMLEMEEKKLAQPELIQ